MICLHVSRGWTGRSLDARRTLFIYWCLRREHSLSVPIPWAGTLRDRF